MYFKLSSYKVSNYSLYHVYFEIYAQNKNYLKKYAKGKW